MATTIAKIVSNVASSSASNSTSTTSTPPITQQQSSGNSISNITSYLKSYPYLFVRESDQTDYFCTICDAYLKEEQLQSHLFDGHRAEGLSEYFVQVCTDNNIPGNVTQGYFPKKRYLYICVVCWAKITKSGDMAVHRKTCKTDICNNSNNDSPVMMALSGKNKTKHATTSNAIIQDGEPTNVVSTPDIPTLMIDSDNEGSVTPGAHSFNGNGNRQNDSPSPSSSQGSLIIDVPDTVPQTAPAPLSLLTSQPSFITSSSTMLSGQGNQPPPIKRGRKKQPHPQQVLPPDRLQKTPSGGGGAQQHPPSASTPSGTTELPKTPLPPLPPLPPLLQSSVLSGGGQPPIQFASNCIQCSLCGSILPSSSYMKHLREFHRVACSLETTACPLCMGVVPLMDMTVHLAAMHGVAPQPAVNALLLWALANNTFVMNEKTKESLKAKTLALTGGGIPTSNATSNIPGGPNNTSFSVTTLTSTPQVTSQAMAIESSSTALAKFPTNPLISNSSIATMPMMLDVLPNLLINNQNSSTVQNVLNPPLNPLISTPPPPLLQQPTQPSQQLPTINVPKPNLGTPSIPMLNMNNSSNASLGTSATNPAGADMTNPAIAMARIPSFLQALLNGGDQTNASAQSTNLTNALNQLASSSPTFPSTKLTIENIVTKLTRNHIGPNNKESFQCLVCSKWFAVPPIKHMRGHIVSSKEERRRSLPLMGGSSHVCLVCYQIFESMAGINAHLQTIHPIVHGANGTDNNFMEGGTIISNGNDYNVDDLPLGATYEHTINKSIFLNGPTVQNNTSLKTSQIPTVIINSQPSTPPKNPTAQSTPSTSGRTNTPQQVGGQNIERGVELDNAGRVKSGKVRKQCELCGQWSNIKWFFKHMSEVHQALFCRCCKEYLPIPEQEEHRRWHAEPPYMGQKIRIEHGQPVIIDRKERASLTPIGSLASWGGSSGGMVVKAVDDGIVPQTPSTRKRKAKNNNTSNTSNVNIATNAISLMGNGITMNSSALDIITSASNSPPSLLGAPPSKIPHSLIQHLDFSSTNSSPTMINAKSAIQQASNGTLPTSNVKDTLMPKETCPVCGILITYKNLARHIKLRHKIKYKFCHKCRKLVPNDTFEEHKYSCKESNNSDIAIGDTVPNMDIRVNYPNPAPNNDQKETDMVAVGDQTTTTVLPTEPIDASDYLDMDNANAVVSQNEGTSEVGVDDITEVHSDENMFDSRKTDTYRSNTSKTKLESLMGKEFKHPRRRCAICGYTVSYSNFKRHLRNAHPNEYNKFEEDCGGDFRKAMATLSHPVNDDGESVVGGDAASLGAHFMGQSLEPDDMDEDEIGEEDIVSPEDLSKESNLSKDTPTEIIETFGKNGGHSNDGESSFVACKICGDHILEDFLERHMSKNHSKEDMMDDVDSNAEGDGDDALKIDEQQTTENDDDEDQEKKLSSSTPKIRQVNIRECPVCMQEMRAEALIKHSKLKHKISLKWCNQCSKYLMKKHHRSHIKKHERGEEIDPTDEDEVIAQSPQANAKETRSKNNDVVVGRLNEESFKDDEDEMDQTEEEDNVTSHFSTSASNIQDDGLKVKNMNDLMARGPLKVTLSSAHGKGAGVHDEKNGKRK